MIDIHTSKDINLKFNFYKYVNLILEIIPKRDVLSLDRIDFVNSYNNYTVSNDNSLACYLATRQGGAIVVNIRNVIHHKIPEYIFNYYSEIASLFLSEIIGHEIGHHIIKYQRHGTKNEEIYAINYARSCYLNYFISRHKSILSAYLLGSINYLNFSRKQRAMFRTSRKELIDFLRERKRDKGGIKEM